MTQLSLEMEKYATKCQCTLTALSNIIAGTTDVQQWNSTTMLMATVAMFVEPQHLELHKT